MLNWYLQLKLLVPITVFTTVTYHLLEQLTGTLSILRSTHFLQKAKPIGKPLWFGSVQPDVLKASFPAAGASD